METIIIIIVFIYFLAWILSHTDKIIGAVIKSFKQIMLRNKTAKDFDGSYIDVKVFYVKTFKTTPCLSFISNLDVAKAYDYVSKGFAGKVLTIYESKDYNWLSSKQTYTISLFTLENKVMIEFGNNYAEVYYDGNNTKSVDELIGIFSTFKAQKEEAVFEINIITQTNRGLDLKPLIIKPTQLDINLFYNDDFKPIDDIIKQRLANENDKGIILLHGLPGTGKTTYLRHLIGSLNKRVLFVSPNVAVNLINPELIDLLIDNPNAVLVIEDAENIIMDRKYSPNSGVSNLLNISDGLLSDCLNVQIICTFNSSIQLVDNALLRKGRLIAKYEFNKLDAKKAQRLSNHLGFDHTISKAMTIADITNPDDMAVEPASHATIGFRSAAAMN